MKFNITFVIMLFFASSVLASSDGCTEALESKYTGADLVVATNKGDVASVQKILNSGSDIDMYSINFALIQASSGGHSDIVNLLLETGANVHVPSSMHKETALVIASREGYTEIVRILIEAGTDVDSQNSLYKETALMVASREGHTEIVRLLLEAGADVDLQDNGGRTALMMASKEGHTEIVRMLLESGMLETEKGYSEVVRLLLEAESKANKKYSEAEIALMIVRSKDTGYDNIVDRLIEAGAKQNRTPFVSGITRFFESLRN